MNRFWLILGFLVLGAGLQAANLPVKRYALFIGADQGGKAQQALKFAGQDARKMEQVMQEVGGVMASDQILLIDPTPDGIRGALASLAAKISGPGGPETRRTEFLFYYSGHSDEVGLLLGDRTYSYKELRDGLQSVPADVRIAILDSCSSGAFARLKGGVQRAPFLDQDSSQMKGHAFLTSSSDTEASQESDSLGGSFFTHYLVSGLRGGADKTGNGMITLNEAYEYAYQYTLARTESTQAGPQHPSYEIQLSGTGDLILADLQASNARLEVGPEVAGRVYVRDGAGQLFAEVVKGSGTPLVLVFPPGTYSVVVVTPKQALTAQVTLASLGTSRLSQKDFQTQVLDRFATRGTSPDAGSNLTSEDQFCGLVSSVSHGLVPPPPYDEYQWEDKTFGMSALDDKAGNLNGIQMSGLVSAVSGATKGIQMSGLVSLTHGEMLGTQFACLFNIAESGFMGTQMAGFFNNTGGAQAGGVQFASLFNWSQADTYWGVQYAAVNLSRNLEGIQYATVNLADDVNGIQFGGFNLVRNMNGIQFGGANVAQDFNGIQFGAANIGADVNGLQFGVVNINSHFEGASFGLVNVSPDAFYRPTVFQNSDGTSGFALQWGMGWTYLVMGVSTEVWSVRSSGAFDQFGGFGVELKSGGFFWDTDLGSVKSYHSTSLQGTRAYGRTSIGWNFGWVGVEGGLMATVDPSGNDYIVGSYRFSAPLKAFVGVFLF